MLPNAAASRLFCFQLGGALAALIVAIGLAAGQTPPKITLDEALAMIGAGEREATSKGYHLSFAVVDGRGDLIAEARMPGAPVATADTAIGTAMVSAIFGLPSAALVPRASFPMMQTLNDASGGRFRYLKGAVPIVRDHYTVGAIAASGATPQQDEDTAAAALASTIRPEKRQ